VFSALNVSKHSTVGYLPHLGNREGLALSLKRGLEAAEEKCRKIKIFFSG